MEYKVLPNRSIPEKKKSKDKKSTSLKEVKYVPVDSKDQSSQGTIPTKFQFDDDYDNWFPWETY